ncbi:hypothetical protein GF354_00585 [Candidatus Peregrinibacteria bacterium]|nr:hypothetical protein [Candidatus Peregrinibacteria bacterium]
MKTKYSKLIKALLIGIIIFMIINYFEGKLFYGDHHDYTAHIINIYFYPLLIIADIINSIIDFSMSAIYLEVVEPVYNNPITITIGILYTSIIIYIYYVLSSLKTFKKIPKFLTPFLFLIIIIILLYLSAIIVNSGIIHPERHIMRYMGP